MINNKENELTIIYHSSRSDDKKARAYAESLPGYAVKYLDLENEDLTETQLAEIANMLNWDLSELMDLTHSDLPQKDRQQLQSLAGEDVLKVLVKDKKLIKTPIVIVGNKAHYYGSGYYIGKEEMANTHIKSQKANADEINRK